jgi:hypothetical protein
MQCLPDGRHFTRLLDESYRLSNWTMNELPDERVAEVLDGLRLLRRRAELVEQAANLMYSNGFDAVVWIFSMSPSAHFSTHALSTPRYLALGRCVMGVLLEQDRVSPPCPGHG